MRKKVFICSPFRGDMEGNARKAAAYCRMACEEGHLPIAPHLLFPQFLNEGIEEERRLGIAMGMELLALCDEVWVFLCHRGCGDRSGRSGVGNAGLHTGRHHGGIGAFRVFEDHQSGG